MKRYKNLQIKGDTRPGAPLYLVEPIGTFGKMKTGSGSHSKMAAMEVGRVQSQMSGSSTELLRESKPSTLLWWTLLFLNGCSLQLQQWCPWAFLLYLIIRWCGRTPKLDQCFGQETSGCQKTIHGQYGPCGHHTEDHGARLYGWQGAAAKNCIPVSNCDTLSNKIGGNTAASCYEFPYPHSMFLVVS